METGGTIFNEFLNKLGSLNNQLDKINNKYNIYKSEYNITGKQSSKIENAKELGKDVGQILKKISNNSYKK